MFYFCYTVTQVLRKQWEVGVLLVLLNKNDVYYVSSISHVIKQEKAFASHFAFPCVKWEKEI